MFGTPYSKNNIIMLQQALENLAEEKTAQP
jgi:hypothetical protein